MQPWLRRRGGEQADGDAGPCRQARTNVAGRAIRDAGARRARGGGTRDQALGRAHPVHDVATLAGDADAIGVRQIAARRRQTSPPCARAPVDQAAIAAAALRRWTVHPAGAADAAARSTGRAVEAREPLAAVRVVRTAGALHTDAGVAHPGVDRRHARGNPRHEATRHLVIAGRGGARIATTAARRGACVVGRGRVARCDRRVRRTIVGQRDVGDGSIARRAGIGNAGRWAGAAGTSSEDDGEHRCTAGARTRQSFIHRGRTSSPGPDCRCARCRLQSAFAIARRQKRRQMPIGCAVDVKQPRPSAQFPALQSLPSVTVPVVTQSVVPSADVVVHERPDGQPLDGIGEHAAGRWQ